MSPASAPPPPPTPPSTPNPVTFETFLPLSRYGNSTHKYTIDLLDSFCIGTVPNGGYIASAFQRVATEHMRTTHKSLTCPDPINLHLEYLRRTSAGPALFTVRDVKLGSRISNLHITLSQPTNPSSPLPSSDPSSSSSSGLESTAIEMQDEVEAYVTCTSLTQETGPTRTTAYKLLPPPHPVNLTQLSENNDTNYVRRRDDPYASFRRASRHMQMHLVRPDRRRSDASPALLDQWIRFRPLMPPPPSSPSSPSSSNSSKEMNQWPTHQGIWTNASLGYVVDIFPQINERFVNAAVEDVVLSPATETSDREIREKARPTSSSDKKPVTSSTFWYPTLNLNLDIKKSLPEEGVEWLFVRVQAKSIKNGRFDLTVEVWDETGDLVALSSHAALIMDMSRNTKRSGQSKKKKEKGDSKI